MPSSLAVLYSSDRMLRTGDQHFPFRQQSDFYYLTGINEPNTALLIFPSAVKEQNREILFIPKTDKHAKIWSGENLTKDAATQISGIKNVLFVNEMPALLHRLIHRIDKIYLNENEMRSAQEEVLSRSQRKNAELIKKYPLHQFCRANPILRSLRMIKSREEIEAVRGAIDITHRGFEHILSALSPGVWEYQLHAILTGTFLHHGSSGHAFPPIIASGLNACTLHYETNQNQCSKGELLLLDFGAEYNNYAADVTRTIPVNGRYSTRQAEIYNAVLTILKRCTEMMVPDKTIAEISLEAGKMMNHALIDLGLLTKKEVRKASEKEKPHRKYFMHGISHHLGLDVHDLSDRDAPLQHGMILTCEPGIYIREEEIGIRLENDILVTDQGPVNLSKQIPIEIEDIESRMQSKLSV